MYDEKAYVDYLNALSISPAKHHKGSNVSSDTSSGCFVATAVYGDYNHPYVLDFKAFRDKVLLHCKAGRLLTNYYYEVSPKLVKAISDNMIFRQIVQYIFLSPLHYIIKFLLRILR